MFGLLRKAFNLQGGSNPNGVAHGVSDSWTPPSYYPWDWWQKDLSISDDAIENNTTVESCVATISQTMAMLPVKHMKRVGKDTWVEVEDSAFARVMRRPNPFQTKSEFIVDLVRKALLTGDGYGVCTRNGRFEIDAIYPQLRMSPYVSFDNRDVYYSLGDETLIKLNGMIPSRDVLHLKFHTKNHPLIGATSLEAAVLSGSIGTSIQGHTDKFFKNMSRPSGVLATDMTLTAEQTKALRSRFNELSQDLNSGGLPILTNGLKYEQVSMSAVDSDIINTYNMTVRDIARVFRIPPALIGDMDKASFANTETLMQYWIATGLGFAVEHLERTLERLFGMDLDPSQRIQFDVDFLLKVDMKSKYDAYKVGITGGFITPNEARSLEGLAPESGGDALYMQMQNVPLELTGKKLEADIESIEAATDQIGKEPTPEIIDTEEVEAKAALIEMSKWTTEKRLELKDIK